MFLSLKIRPLRCPRNRSARLESPNSTRMETSVVERIATQWIPLRNPQDSSPSSQQPARILDLKSPPFRTVLLFGLPCPSNFRTKLPHESTLRHAFQKFRPTQNLSSSAHHNISRQQTTNLLPDFTTFSVLLLLLLSRYVICTVF